MPLLLEDLADEATQSNQRIAARFTEELRRLETLQREGVGESVSLAAVEAAEQATDLVQAQVAQAESNWTTTVKLLGKNPLRADAEDIIRSALRLLESARELVSLLRGLWTLATRLDTAASRLIELEPLEHRLDRSIAEAERALKHRKDGWQAADPNRLAEGLRLSRDGKIVTAEEAQARFRSS